MDLRSTRGRTGLELVTHHQKLATSRRQGALSLVLVSLAVITGDIVFEYSKFRNAPVGDIACGDKLRQRTFPLASHTLPRNTAEWTRAGPCIETRHNIVRQNVKKMGPDMVVQTQGGPKQRRKQVRWKPTHRRSTHPSTALHVFQQK